MTDGELNKLVERALAEDVGSGDVTTEATVGESANAAAEISQKSAGVISGLVVAEAVFQLSDCSVEIQQHVAEGIWRESGPVLTLKGNARALLTAERTALNFLGHLSGIATLTNRFVRQLEGTDTKLLDTRKTLPGMRALEKQAVLDGGGYNHRFGLFDAILIKENHIAMAGGVEPAIKQARAFDARLHLTVECQTLADVKAALVAQPDRVLLDNMSVDAVSEAVALVNGTVEVEASGGIELDNIRDYALTGVNFISVGALTHSAASLDVSLSLAISE